GEVIIKPVTEQEHETKTNYLAERRLRLFLENAKDYALMLLDTNCHVLEWLGAAESITGWSAEEQTGKYFGVLFTPEDQAAGVPERELQTAATTGRAEDTRWHIKKDGTRFFADGVTTAFRDKNGKLQGYGKIFHDVTRQKLADEALKQSREQFQLLLNSVAEGICGVNREGVCVFINPAGAKTLAYTPAEIIGRRMQDFIFDQPPGSDDANPPNEILRAISDGRSFRGDNGVLKCEQSGAFLPIQFSVNPMVTDGVNTGAVIAFTDVSERRQVEAELRENERRLKFVMDSVPQKLFTANPLGKLTYVNSQGYEYAGVNSDRQEKWAWTMLVHPDDLQLSVEAWRQCVGSGTEFEMEHRFRRYDGQYHWHLTRALPMRDASGQISMWVGSNTDIHEVKTAEVKLGDRLVHEQQNAARLSAVARASRAVNSVLSVQQIAQILAKE